MSSEQALDVLRTNCPDYKIEILLSVAVQCAKKKYDRDEIIAMVTTLVDVMPGHVEVSSSITGYL